MVCMQFKRNKHAHGDLYAMMEEMGRAARAAARALARASTEAKNSALAAMAAGLRSESASIVQANAEDARKAKKAGCDTAFVDRLTV